MTAVGAEIGSCIRAHRIESRPAPAGTRAAEARDELLRPKHGHRIEARGAFVRDTIRLDPEPSSANCPAVAMSDARLLVPERDERIDPRGVVRGDVG